VIEGPSKIDEVIKNTKIESGWKTTYIWKLKPNGDWTNGNAPINLFVQFNQDYDDIRKIDFTIANPYILDEHYSGPAPTHTAAPSSTDQPPSSEGSPGFGALSALAGTALVVMLRRRRI
jgi:MAST domain-containing protein